MDLTPYVESLGRDLTAAAEAGGPEARESAERLALALEPAVRLALMEALAQAAAEITSELPAGSVEVRLRGREPQLVVDVSSLPGPAASPSAGAAEEDDGSVARVTLRIPEAVKARAEELAAQSGQSLNSWIVAALRGATRERSETHDLSSVPFGEGFPFGRGPRRMTGWV